MSSNITAVEEAVEVSSVESVLAAGIETPAYVYDMGEVRANYKRLRAALPVGSEIYYSLKANPHPFVLATLRSQGALPEVCSIGELDQAIAAGWFASQVLYTGPAKRDQDVRYALVTGVRYFSVDSANALDQLNDLATEVNCEVSCLLRINDDQPIAGQGLAMTGVPSQFGADLQLVLSNPKQYTNRERVRVTGLHLYMGTNIAEAESLLLQFERSIATSVKLIDVLREHDVEIRTLDLGGGFGAPFAQTGHAFHFEGLSQGLEELCETYFSRKANDFPHIVFESGRYLIGTAGSLLTRVLDVKISHGKSFAILDSGINHLGGMSGLRRLPPLNPHLVHQREAPYIQYAVTGPLCTPLDIWSRNSNLPALESGDLLIVPNVGAYGLYASLIGFLGHPAPMEVVIDNGCVVNVPQLELVRR